MLKEGNYQDVKKSIDLLFPVFFHTFVVKQTRLNLHEKPIDF